MYALSRVSLIHQFSLVPERLQIDVDGLIFPLLDSFRSLLVSMLEWQVKQLSSFYDERKWRSVLVGGFLTARLVHTLIMRDISSNIHLHSLTYKVIIIDYNFIYILITIKFLVSSQLYLQNVMYDLIINLIHFIKRHG